MAEQVGVMKENINRIRDGGTRTIGEDLGLMDFGLVDRLLACFKTPNQKSQPTNFQASALLTTSHIPSH